MALYCQVQYIDETLAIAGVLRIDSALLLADTEDDTADVDDDEPFEHWSDLCSHCKVNLEVQSRTLAQRRMAIILKAIVKLPRDIIFLGGPKLTIRNFTWSPETLMSKLPYKVRDKSLAGECTEDG